MITRRNLFKALVAASAVLPASIKHRLPAPPFNTGLLKPFGKIRIYDGGGTKLAEMGIFYHPFKNALIVESTTAIASGVAARGEVEREGKEPVPVSVGTQGADVNFNTCCIPSGASISLPTFTFIE